MYESEFSVAIIIKQNRVINMCICTVVSQVHVNSQITDSAYKFDGVVAKNNCACVCVLRHDWSTSIIKTNCLTVTALDIESITSHQLFFTVLFDRVTVTLNKVV